MKRYLIKLNYTVQVTAQFDITEHQLKEALSEERFGEMDGEAWQKAERLFTNAGIDMADAISQSTWDYQPIELGTMGFDIEREYQTDQAAESDTSQDIYYELEAGEVILNLNRVVGLDDVEVVEHESAY